MEQINHNNFPEAIGQICQRLDSIETILRKQEHSPQQDKEEFITLKQVCELTGYAPPTIYGFIAKNTIPHFKRGQRLFFERESIIAWIREGKSKSKAEVEAETETHVINNRKKK